jgi:sec-independent protein translocase protein TatC
MSDDLEKKSETNHALVEHLTELRKVLFKSLIFFVVLFGASLIYMPKILPLLSNGYNIVLLGPLDVIRFYTGVAGALSLGLTTPFIGYQLWKFVKPGLTNKERRITLTYIPAIFLSFMTGVSFGYFIVFPILFKFLMKLGKSAFDVLITAREYFVFLLTSTLSLGFLFELPIVMVFLTSIGVITPSKLKNVRKYAYLVLAIISALITPPDFISQILVLTPLIILYEIGVMLSMVALKNKMKKETELSS